MHDDEEPNTTEPEKPKNSSNGKPDKTIRKKLENYLEEMELKRQLNDWDDIRED
jgi:hypothetical protein